jgi:hypothetical protein
MASQIITRDKPKVYPPVGRCIYCGRAGGLQGLSKEHISPFGLSGACILPKSSCASCRQMTGAFEQVCLRVNFHNFRVHSNLPTRRPKERPKDLPLNILRNQTYQTIRLPVEDHPHHLMMPVFQPPGIFTSAHLPFDYAGTTMLVIYFDGWVEKTSKVSCKEILPHNFDFESFVRMLAKIGHGYAVAELGLNSFKPLLADLIAWRDPTLARYLVGGMNIEIPLAPCPPSRWTTSQLHLFFYRAFVDRSFIVVRIRLFPYYPASPQYAGEFLPEFCPNGLTI